VAPQLGNTVTEIKLDNPKELSIARKSHLGMTGYELTLLTRWMDATNFPFCGWQLPAKTVKK
jgi:hypothetical protein